jgi:hypothetical protein
MALIRVSCAGFFAGEGSCAPPAPQEDCRLKRAGLRIEMPQSDRERSEWQRFKRPWKWDSGFLPVPAFGMPQPCRISRLGQTARFPSPVWYDHLTFQAYDQVESDPTACEEFQ